jgi:hypothetical protein
MVAAEIDAHTGELATEWCESTTREWFKPGQEPTEYCHRHSEPPDEFETDDGFGDRLRDAFRRIFRM